ncbi:hypothetical protein KIMH_07800 [Bombiscardovia apis]|uniref:Transmembrane protein alanine and leucine rich n=1 Tax=Bombiscardovia apis TaxID=2932182 RepID=A0ABM8BCP4_9BIFI|nr:DUF6541 family protein [Bombiscardovia apis]BDR54669.1 hypothetical protein KIMH_07800 [Bombiscardovia apis]
MRQEDDSREKAALEHSLGNGGGSARVLRRAALPLSSVVGVLLAFSIVLTWFSRFGAAWNLPIHEIDAPAHYYFIRKILNEGVGAAGRLWPNDAYYPPMFHLLAAGLIKLGALFGIQVSIYAAFNIIWIATSGLVWPAGVLLLSTYWTRQVDGLQSQRAPGDDATASASSRALGWRPFSCLMAVLVPILAVSSPAHPFTMLAVGPLIAYGLATSLLPFWLYATLRLLDCLAQLKRTPAKTTLRWLLITAALAVLCLFAHPRIIFTWLLLMVPFILLRLPWKWIAGMAVLVLLGAVAFLFYMKASYKSSRYGNPGDWFHTYQPNRTVPEALGRFITDNVSGPAGWAMAALVVTAIVIAIALVVKPQLTSLPHARVHALALLLSAALVALVYVCSTALTGWFPNIMAGAWYRTETRPLTIIPFALIPLICFALCAIAGMRVPARQPWLTLCSVVLVALVLCGCQIHNPGRQELADQINESTILENEDPYEQLTQSKMQVLREVVAITGTKATIISDPLNGSMYGATVFGANMLYPIYNPMTEKNGAIFMQVEQAFASADPATLLNTVCLVEPSGEKYFLSMGPQAHSLSAYTFKGQYDPFHDQNHIQAYLESGALVKVADFSAQGSFAHDWALYRFTCKR